MSRLIRVAALGVTAAALASVVACGGLGSSQNPTALEGIEWRLVSSSDTSADFAGAGITVSFDGTTMGGFSGVNQYGGDYSANADGSLGTGTFASTLMAGPEPLMQAEAAYLGMLQRVDSFTVEGGTLTLTTTEGETLTFTE